MSEPEQITYDSPKLAETVLKRSVRDAAESLVGGFDWSETAEGYEFWSVVYHRLMSMAAGQFRLPPAKEMRA
ncbi:hypothetical protein [Roseomonas haemaphysalidis]|uniref:Uncharacterized protein n=1 Tax=Roseomonas haemaphysalidis TaxID=2768162 RepID=A0ABS3KTR2_9PROT|nr:hypothetical protein [Roseomonas haemaphysalidis]MBO1080859.1 hypothetical protein [Roseomonas haemaphysalidis]